MGICPPSVPRRPTWSSKRGFLCRRRFYGSDGGDSTASNFLKSSFPWTTGPGMNTFLRFEPVVGPGTIRLSSLWGSLSKTPWFATFSGLQVLPQARSPEALLSLYWTVTVAKSKGRPLVWISFASFVCKILLPLFVRGLFGRLKEVAFHPPRKCPWLVFLLGLKGKAQKKGNFFPFPWEVIAYLTENLPG